VAVVKVIPSRKKNLIAVQVKRMRPLVLNKLVCKREFIPLRKIGSDSDLLPICNSFLPARKFCLAEPLKPLPKSNAAGGFGLLDNLHHGITARTRNRPSAFPLVFNQRILAQIAAVVSSSAMRVFATTRDA